MQLDEVWDRVLYLGECDALHSAIARVIARLPPSVQTFATDRCAFVSVGHCYGMALPGKIGVHAQERRARNTWIICLLETTPAEHLESVIAHELAHAWLGHDKLSVDFPRDSEEQACAQVAEWGFEGIGADVKFCAQPERDG